MNTFCQSCGMPMKKNPGNGGTNADGTKSPEYCSYCFQKGSFKNPDFSARQMQDFCMQKMKEKGIPTFIAWLLTRSIPRLKRWNQPNS